MLTKSMIEGFTLIELLIVMAVIGILAAIVLVAINPAEQLARGRDTQRLHAVEQLGHAVTNWNVSINSGTGYPNAAGWQNTLVSNNDIINQISVPQPPTRCTSSRTGDICYKSQKNPTVDAVVWTPVESKEFTQKGGCGVGSTPPFPIVVYIASQGKAGVDCVTDNTTAPGYSDTLY